MRIRHLKNYAAVMMSIVITGCSVFDANADAKELVRQQLKDPDSAQFDGLLRNGNTICGYVNGKNSYGAYEGRQAFVANGVEVTLDDRSPKFHSLVSSNCDTSFVVEWGSKDTQKGIQASEALSKALKASSGRK